MQSTGSPLFLLRGVRFVMNLQDRSMTASLFTFLSCFLCSFLSTSGAKASKEHDNGIVNALIPGYDGNGRLSWELKANEVLSVQGDLYHATKPSLSFFGQNRIRMKARSASGIFNVKVGHARGNQVLFVEGDGFSAHGKKWNWNQKSEKGTQHMEFNERSMVSFDTNLKSFLEEKRSLTIDACPLEEPLIESPVPTIAHADSIEFLAVDEKSHHFFLEGNVSVSGNELLLLSGRMKVEFENDGNSTSGEIGRISKISAFEQVEFSQEGRICYSDSLTMDVLKGEVLLQGKPARVVDEEWGAAVGDRIILEKGKRRARVLRGDSGGRPRLELPAIPDLGFDIKGKNP